VSGTYTAQDGSRRFTTEIIADDMLLLNSGKGNGVTEHPQAAERPAAAPEQPAAPSVSPADQPDGEQDINPDEIPY
jgi:single-stranded DNA-binding protein